MADLVVTGGVLIPIDPERRIITDGVRACPEAEDVWLEAARR